MKKNKKIRYYSRFFLTSCFILAAGDSCIGASDVPVNESFDSLINMIWTSVVGTGSQGMPDKTATAIYMCQPGIPVNPATLDGMLDASNPQGLPAPLQAFSEWFDKIPDITLLRWNPSTGSTVSGAYGSVVGSANSDAKPFTNTEEAIYKRAHDILWTTRPSLLSPDDPSKAETVKSPVYTQYSSAQQAYQTAVANYNMNRVAADLTTPQGQNQWLVQGGILQTAIQNAWDAWNAAYKTDIEQALGILGSTLKNGTATEITRVQGVFQRAGQTSIILGGTNWYPVYTFPVQWWKPDAPGWTSITQTTSSNYKQAEQHTKSFSSSASFLGMFSIGGSGGYSSEHSSEIDVSKNLSLKMEYTVIDIQRPWLDMNWMKAQDWYSSSVKAGEISSGTVSGNNNDMLLPMVPGRFVAARNVEMTANWSKSTADLFAQHIQAGVSFGYGPFKIGGNYEQGDAQQTFKSEFDGKTLKIPGLQIIGFVGATPPKSAPLSKPTVSDN
jgi:hypothetical protein